jgi:hypothetical protein
MTDFQTIITRAIEHIRDQQSPDGSFANLSSFFIDNFSNALPRHTTFFTANILACLQHVPDQTADIQKLAVQFLLKEKSVRWTFNYWADRMGKQGDASYPKYPDDLDDTFAALTALVQYDAAIVDGHVFAAIAKLLISREVKEGGPYRTWLVTDDAPSVWQDVDPVVNSTIGYFLSLIGVQLPQLEHFIDAAVRDGSLSSPYYPGMIHVGYFLSRFYKDRGAAGTRIKLAHIILAHIAQNRGKDTTALEQAMAMLALINLGHANDIPPRAADLLAARVEHEGFLPYAFCIDPAREGKQCHAGASALTAAFCAEALARYSVASREQHSHPDRDIQMPTTHDHIRNLARASCGTLGPRLRTIAFARIADMADEKITTLAYEFRKILYKHGDLVPLDIVEQLSLANLYGWIAYTIHDDALDGEIDPSLLPCANFFLRMLTETYGILDARIPGVRSMFDDTMDCVDEANTWEQKFCRIAAHADTSGGTLPRELPQFGDHQTLADRSIGHAMGPLAELLLAGYARSSEEYTMAESFFRHYLIARQLHDDAHDWADDLHRRRVNSVGTLVLRRFREQYPEKAEKAVIDEIAPELQKIFWRETIDSVTGAIDFHIAEARRARNQSRILTNTDFIEDELRILETGARRAIKERNDAIVFLDDYRTDTPD